MRKNNKVHAKIVFLTLSLCICAHPTLGAEKGASPRVSLYDIISSNDNALCKAVVKAINAQIKRGSEVKSFGISNELKWINTENLAKKERSENYYGDIQQMSIDIDNDGSKNKIYKTRLSIRGEKRRPFTFSKMTFLYLKKCRLNYYLMMQTMSLIFGEAPENLI